MKIENKVALITGGGSGIGAAIARRFVDEGAMVCITGRRQKNLDEVAAALPGDRVTTCSGDVSKEQDVQRMVETAVSFGGGLDVLINNAAMSSQGPVSELPPDVWRQMMDTNLTGPFLLMRAAIPHMISRGAGSIINIASVGGQRCLPGMPAYCSSKAGLIMLSQTGGLGLRAPEYPLQCRVPRGNQNAYDGKRVRPVRRNARHGNRCFFCQDFIGAAAAPLRSAGGNQRPVCVPGQ